MTRSGAAAEAEVLERFARAVAAFDRGACAEEATAELTPDLYAALPDGLVKEAVRAAFVHLAADPPRAGREAAVRAAVAGLARLAGRADLVMLSEAFPGKRGDDP